MYIYTYIYIYAALLYSTLRFFRFRSTHRIYGSTVTKDKTRDGLTQPGGQDQTQFGEVRGFGSEQSVACAGRINAYTMQRARSQA